MHYNQHLSKILIALAVLGIVVPITSASHLLTGMVTHDSPLTTLDIEASVQKYTPSATINIEGRTKPFAIIHGFVNNVRVRVYNTKADGRFKLLNMPLIEGENTIKLEAKEGEASVSKEYAIVYDGTPPTITLSQPIPQATQANSLTVAGDVNEKVTIYYRVIHRADSIPPDLVSNFKATKLESNAIELGWDPSTATDLKEYLLERDGKRIATTTLTTFRDEGLQSNKPYTYSLAAVDASCNIGTESTVTATTKTGGANASAQAPPSVNLSCQVPYQTTTAGSPFSIILALIAGINDIEIIFEDQAGNQEIIKQTVLMDNSGPKFIETNLEELSPSYIPDITIKGKLDEKATVFVYVNDESKPSEFEVTEDDGTFSIKIRLRTDVRIKKGKGKITVEAGEGWANKIKLEAVDLAGNKAAHGPIDVDFLLCGSGTWWQPYIGEPLPSILLPRLMIQGVQQIGIPFNITYVGGHQVKLGKVDVRQIPLAAGAAKDFDHDWVTVNEYTKAKGNKSLIGYAQIQFENVNPLPDKPDAGPNERERALSDHRKGECLVPGVGCVKLFLQMEIQFQEIYSVEPTDPNRPVSTPKIEPRVQRVCMPLDIAIDQTIPSDIIPKGLLKNAVKLTEKAIELIDKILKPLTTIGEYVLYGCLASNLWLYFNFFTEKLSCEGNALLSTAAGGGWSKDVAEAGLCEEAYSASGDAQKKQNCLTCQKKLESRKKFEMTVMHALCDRIGCPSAPTFSTYIKDKSGKATALDVDVTKPEVAKWAVGGPPGKIYSGNDCAFTYVSSDKKISMDFITPTYAGIETTSGTFITPGGSRTVTSSGKLGIRALHDIAKGKIAPQQGLKLDDCKKYVRPAHPACCGVTYQQEWSSACGIGVVLGSGLDTFDELKQSTCLAAQQANADASDLSCNSLWNSVAGFCEKNTGKPTVRPENTGAIWEGPLSSRSLADGNAVYAFIVPVDFKVRGLPEIGLGLGGTAQRYRVLSGYMTRAEKPAAVKAEEKKLELGEIEFEVGGLKPVAERDLTEHFIEKPGESQAEKTARLQKFHAAFCAPYAEGWKPRPCDKEGNVKILYERVHNIVGVPEQQYIVQPNSGFLRSVECVCIPAVTSYLQMWRTVLGAFHACFSKILLTGEGSEGFCAAKMSGVICDLLFEAISCFTQKFSVGVGERVEVSGFSNVLSSLTGAGTDVSRSVNQRYGETSLYKSLFSERKLVHAICTWAFTGTWDLDMSGLFQQQVEEIPVDSEGALTTCQRTFISYDPTTSPAGLTTWAYRIAGGLIAGADVNYRLKLKCSSGFTCDPRDYRDGKCDCTTSERTITVNSPEVGSGRASKFDLVNFDTPFLVSAQSSPDSDIRYDTAILEWEWTDPQTKQLRTDKTDCEIRETEGGQPPAFCSLDLFSGKFRCLFGEMEHGIRIINASATQETFFLNQPLAFGLMIKQKYPEERRLHNSAKKFLTYEIKDQLGRTIEATIDNVKKPLRTTSDEAKAYHTLETDGTYLFTLPKPEDTTPLGKFKLDKETIITYAGGTVVQRPKQQVWGVSALPDKVRSITLKSNNVAYNQKMRFLVHYPNFKQQQAEADFSVYRITPAAPDPVLPLPNNGWRGYALEPALATGKQASGQIITKTFRITEQNTPPIDGIIEIDHIATLQPTGNELQILVEYSPTQPKAPDPCTEADVSKRPMIPWTAVFAIYDADRQGNPTDQVSTDPETGTPQQTTTTFKVLCATKAEWEKIQQVTGTSQTQPKQCKPITECAIDSCLDFDIESCMMCVAPQCPSEKPSCLTEEKECPNQPTFKATKPGSFGNVATVTLTWNAVPQAQGYELQLHVFRDGKFEEFGFIQTQNPTHVMDLLPGQYRWKTHAKLGANSFSSWSEERLFRVTP